MQPHGILETAVYVEDLEAAARFYEKVIGLERFSHEEGRHLFYRCGEGMFLIFDHRTTRHSSLSAASIHVPLHGTPPPGHMAFTIHESEIENWRRHLGACGVPIEMEIDWPQGGHSLYVRDPANNSIELATPKIWGIRE